MSVGITIGDSFPCEYEENDRGPSLRRLKRLAITEKCHHVRYVGVDEIGVEMLVMFDSLCASELQRCRKAPCSDGIAVFLRNKVGGPFTGSTSVQVEFSSLDELLLTFLPCESPTDQPCGVIRVNRRVPPTSLKHRDMWPTAFSLRAVRVFQDLNTYAFARLMLTVTPTAPASSQLEGSIQALIRIPRVDECTGESTSRVATNSIVATKDLLPEESTTPGTDELFTVLPADKLEKWTGGAQFLTVAVVFTDIVNSTVLCNQLGDTRWITMLKTHIETADGLVRLSNGIRLKHTGDGVLAIFHNATEAVRFALGLYKGTGDAIMKIRVGVHKGEMSIMGSDAIGRHVHFAARVMGHATEGGIVVSDPIKEDIESRAEPGTQAFRWTEFSGVNLKGFPQPERLWGLTEA